MEANFYTMKCITNMHMGSGDINFNIVDNEVQRDPVTGLPTMFSSGIKGALREHFGNHEKVVDIFGSDIMESNKDNKGKSVPGKLKFLSGYLLFLPVRASKGTQAYYLVTTKEILIQFDVLYQSIMGKTVFGNLLQSIQAKVTYAPEGAEVDGIKTKNEKIPEQLMSVLAKLAGAENKDRIMIMEEKLVKEINLPVLARNQLDNGISKNLWYEEVVPHEAVFFTAVLADGTASGLDALQSFDQYITGENGNSLVQFGGNASIGYGLTKVSKVEV